MVNNIQTDVENYVLNHISDIESELFDAYGERTFEWEVEGYSRHNDLLIYRVSARVFDIEREAQYTGEDYYYSEETMTYSLRIDGAEYYFDADDDEGDIYTEWNFEGFNEDNEYRITTREIS